ncbi:MAG: PfkB family carbohydrate kinase [candidate division Zixibacteria bacterium]
MKKTVDALGLGIAPVDFFVTMRSFPLPGKKIDGIPQSSLIAGGGPIPNSLCTFSKLGGRASLIAPFGDDRWAKFAREEPDKFGVRHNLCVIRKNCSSARAFAWIEQQSGNRTIVLDMPQRIFIHPRDFKLSCLPIPKLIHLDGRHLKAAVKLAHWGKKVDARVMLDIGSVRNKVDELFPYLDFLICADDYARHYFNTRSIKKAASGFKKIGIPEVVVTCGTNGSFGIDSFNNQHRQKAFKIKAVDTTGAGDAFHGGYLFGLLKGWDLERKMKFASATAALKCLKPEARTGIPSYRQTIAFIKKHRKFHD